MPGGMLLCSRTCQAACGPAEEHGERHVALQKSMPGGMLLFKRATLENHVVSRFFLIETDDGKNGLRRKLMSSKMATRKTNVVPRFFLWHRTMRSTLLRLSTPCDRKFGLLSHHAIVNLECCHTMRSYVWIGTILT